MRLRPRTESLRSVSARAENLVLDARSIGGGAVSWQPFRWPIRRSPVAANAPNGRCVAFEKYDGTNLHWVWDREYGWITFGTRRDSFYLDSTGVADFHAAHPGLEETPGL